MKTLLLLRHAKSDWGDASLPDHDRPLKKRGIKAAGRIGQLLRDRVPHPDLVLCSTAVRARETLRLALDEAHVSPPTEFLEDLYHCPPNQFIETLCHLAEPTETVLLVGHNPGMEEFLLQLCDEPVAVPTATLAQVELDLDAWSDFTISTRGRLINIWRPRELDDG